jgi:hypothetical protein
MMGLLKENATVKEKLAHEETGHALGEGKLRELFRRPSEHLGELYR